MEITDLNSWWKTGEIEKEYSDLKRRDEFKEILNFIKERQIIVITGLRRTGKTVLMYHLINHLLKNKINAKNILYFGFDFSVDSIEGILSKYKEITNVDYKKEKIYVFLDEIQKADNWQNQIKIFYDLYKNIKFFISGSSSLFIKKKTKESLAGRSFDFQIAPMKFIEYLELKGKEKLIESPKIYKNEIENELKHYTKTGGFPELINEIDDFKIKKYIKELVIDKIIYIDIPKAFKIEEPELLQTLLSIISSSPGMITDYDSISNDLKRNRKTISNYLFYLEEAFLIKKVYNYSKNLLTSEKKLKRFYPTSTSFSYLFSAEQGKVIETLVLMNKNFKFFSRSGNNEVDFINVENEKISPIEIKYKDNFKEKETKALLKFMNKHNLKESLIITKDYESEEKFKEKKIKFIPLWKWLLKKEIQ